MPHRRADLAAAGRIGGYTKASRYSPRELTLAARSAFLSKFLAEVDTREPGLSEEERQRRAGLLLRARMARLAHASAKARRAKKNRQLAPGGGEEAGDGD